MRRVPPGRAGRLWLLAKLGAARRSSELLDQKRQILMRQLAKASALADQTRADWEKTCHEAESWLWRLTLLGGQREIHVLGADRQGRAQVEVSWKSSMGLEQPEADRCILPPAEPLLDVSGNVAGAPTVEAYREAIAAALAHAAAAEALRRVQNELASTRRRLRSITHRRIPELESLLADLELRLDASELEDHVVRRWARDQVRSFEPGAV